MERKKRKERRKEGRKEGRKGTIGKKKARLVVGFPSNSRKQLSQFGGGAGKKVLMNVVVVRPRCCVLLRTFACAEYS
jgi:hypothetical protein